MGSEDEDADGYGEHGAQEDGTGGDILGGFGEGVVVTGGEVDTGFGDSVQHFGNEDDGDGDKEHSEFDGCEAEHNAGSDDDECHGQMHARVTLGAHGIDEAVPGVNEAAQES